MFTFKMADIQRYTDEPLTEGDTFVIDNDKGGYNEYRVMSIRGEQAHCQLIATLE